MNEEALKKEFEYPPDYDSTKAWGVLAERIFRQALGIMEGTVRRSTDRETLWEDYATLASDCIKAAIDGDKDWKKRVERYR